MKNFIAIIISITSFTAWSQCGGAVGCPTLQMSGTSVTCYGSSDGTASVSETSGAPSADITYSWSTGQTTKSITGLAAGSYSVVVKNTCTGCTSSGVYTVNSPDPITVSTTKTDVNCFGGSDGTIQSSAIGGVAPYSYTWSNSATTQNVTGLAQGTYTVTVKDFNKCTQTKTQTINQPTSALGSSFTKVDVKCFGNADGAIDISPFGGTPPYAYSWSSGQITQDISGVPAQSYSLNIRDNKNCQHNKTIQVNQPPVLNASIVSKAVSCFGSADGLVAVSPVGGTAPYNYTWSNSTHVYSQNVSQLQNVPSDLYSVNITDANNCQKSLSKAVPTPSEVKISSATITPVKCFGESTGSVELSIVGGTSSGSYNFVWSNSAGVMPSQTTNKLNNVVAGTYTVVVSDDNDCEKTATYVVQQPQSPLSIITNKVTHILCHGENTGAVDITPNGGTPGYTYSWQNSSGLNVGSTQDKVQLIAETYTVVVTDANGCTSNESYTLNQPNAPLQQTFTIDDVVCFGESNGAININTTGGTSPYTYKWNNSSFQLSHTGEDLVNYPADDYDLLITDANACTVNASYTIPQPDLLTGSIAHVDILCKNDNTGSIDLSVQGGVTNYQYNWSNLATTQDLNNLVAGKYSVTVTDANFCTFKDSVTLIEPADTLSYSFTQTEVTCNGEANGSIAVTASGGSPNYTMNWSSGQTDFNIDKLSAGKYKFTITDDHNCSVSDSTEITQPDELVANESITWVTCHGFSDGEIDITPTGGTAPYSYRWYNSNFALSAQTQDLIGFPYDVYKLEMKDSLNCSTEIFVELMQPEPLSLSTTQKNVTCSGGSDGAIDLTVVGGNPGYFYQWSSGQTTEDLVDIPIGFYTAVVTDTKNCIDSTTVRILEPNPIEIDFVVTEVSCKDQMDGEIKSFPFGGTGAFMYEWSNESTEDYIDELLGGYYSLTVTDIVGCTHTDSAFVPTNPESCISPPNAFTPNGDAYNDTWHLENIHLYDEMNLQIYNKWGEVVYQQIGEYKEWDGIFKGKPLPVETYFYILVLNQSLEPIKGQVTIVR